MSTAHTKCLLTPDFLYSLVMANVKSFSPPSSTSAVKPEFSGEAYLSGSSLFGAALVSSSSDFCATSRFL